MPLCLFFCSRGQLGCLTSTASSLTNKAEKQSALPERSNPTHDDLCEVVEPRAATQVPSMVLPLQVLVSTIFEFRMGRIRTRLAGA